MKLEYLIPALHGKNWEHRENAQPEAGQFISNKVLPTSLDRNSEIQNWPLHVECKQRRKEGAAVAAWWVAGFIRKGAYIQGLS